VQVKGDLAFGAVSAGNTHSCGVTPKGEAYCWGSGFTGELGNGSDVASSVPVLVFGTKH
jgi:alpha-tubulin suppressor-like RCC1 family protein